MSTKLNYKQVANVERRTWDKETYEARAKARQEAESTEESRKHPNHTNNKGEGGDDIVHVDSAKEEFQPAVEGAAGPLNSKRAFLKARRSKVDLEGKLGTSEIIHPDAVGTVVTATPLENAADAPKVTDGVVKSSTGVGWHCKVCDCFLKDSMTYLDHINGRKHQRKLGYSMRVEQSTTDQVKHTLAVLKNKKNSSSSGASGSSGIASDSLGKGYDKDDEDGMDEYEEMVKKKDEDRLARRARRREERKKRHLQKAKKEQNEVDLNPANDENGEDGRQKEVEEKEEVEEDDNDAAQNIAAMMGFSSFGGM